jgi:hypothetical protein
MSVGRDFVEPEGELGDRRVPGAGPGRVLDGERGPAVAAQYLDFGVGTHPVRQARIDRPGNADMAVGVGIQDDQVAVLSDVHADLAVRSRRVARLVEEEADRNAFRSVRRHGRRHRPGMHRDSGSNSGKQGGDTHRQLLAVS